MEASDQNVYVISLDAIDLNLLPSLYNIRDDRIAPLWTTSNLDRRNNEYYQFEIKSKDSEESVKDKSPKCEFENILCDICNIEVPKPFWSKHRRSPRHITNLKIANTAVLRMKKYINNTDNENCCTDCEDIDPAAYFCAVCVTVVDSKEQTTHEKSLAHKNSVILEKIYSDFLLLYNCQDEINDGIPKNETKYTIENDLDTSISDGVVKFVNETNTSNKVLKPPIKKQIDSLDKPIEMKNDNVLTKAGIMHKKANNSLDKPIEMKNDNVLTKAGIMHKKANNSLDKPIEMKNDNVLTKAGIMHEKANNSLDKPIEMKNDNVLTKAGIMHEKANNSLDKPIEMKNDNVLTKAGIMHEKANNSLDKPIEMKNDNVLTKARIMHEKAKDNSISDYLSLLNNSVEGSMVFELQNDNNHNIIKIITIDGSVVKVREENFHGFNRLGKNRIQCYPCGEVFTEKLIEKHKLSEKHMQYMITPLEDKHCARPIGDFLSHCLICNTITELDLHPLLDINHKVKLKEALINETKELSQCSHKESDKVVIPKDTMESNEKDNTWIEVTKKIRKVDIQNSDTTNEGEEGVIENKYFCSACNEFISIFRRSKHNSTAKHISNSKSKYHYLMREMDNKLFCKVCDVEIKNSNVQVKKHVLGNDHIEKYKQKLSDNKIVNFIGLEAVFSCELCNVLIVLKHELLHINEKSHKAKWFSTEHNLEKTNPSDDDDDDHVDENDISDSTIYYQMEKTKFPNLVNCKVCKVVVILNEMQGHFFSVKHNTNYNKLLEDNHMLLKMNDCYCKVCNVSVGKKNELEHASGKNHNRMLKQYLGLPNANGVSKSTVIDATVSVSTDKQNLSNNNARIMSFPPSMSNAKDITNTVSNVKDMNNMGEPGIESEMLALLLPTRNPKEVMCKVCQVTVPFNVHNVTTHMNGNNHKLAQKTESEMLALLLPTRNPKEVMCKVCQVTVPFNVHNVTTHMNGNKHKLAQKTLLEEEAKICQTE